MICSIIIATFNRASALEKTLRSIAGISVPSGWDVELIVADNASTDDTAAVAGNAKLKNVEVRYLHEGRKGKSNALNSSLALARGQIVLFIDDDVSPARDWLERMGRPILERECDGAVGRIILAEELRRPWMTDGNTGGLASYNGPGENPLEFVGANVGVHRSVFEKIPAFDPEIGPGALGAFEDTLFSWQLAETGFKLRYIPEASVTHYPDPTRLSRCHCLSYSRLYGGSKAYVLYHWKHEMVPFPLWSYYYLGLKLRLRRLLKPPSPDAEVVPPWEMSYVANMEKCRQFRIESRRPRNYSKRGLRKIGA